MAKNDPTVRQLLSLKEECQEKGAPDYVFEGIKKTLDIIKARDDYCEKVSSQASEALRNIISETQMHPWKKVFEEGKSKWNLSPGMVSGHLEGQFLQSIVKMQGAKKVLELGMYTGYGALAFAEALPDDGVVVTCEIDPYLESLAKGLFSKSPHGKKITIRIGPAIETLRQLANEKQSFDLVFIDADKQGYKDYYQTVMDNGLLNKDGTIVFDNALFHGLPYVDSKSIADSKASERAKDLGLAIKECNEFLSKDERIHKVMVPIGDGMFIVRKKE